MTLRRMNHLGLVLLATALLAACGGGTPTDAASARPSADTDEPSEAARPTAQASEAAGPSESASSSEEASGEIAVPLEFPCGVIDLGAVEQLIGGAIVTSFEWEPGDQPFGDSTPPSSNFGCQYLADRSADGGPASEFGIVLLGEELSDEEWESVTSARLGDCEGLEVAVDLAEATAVRCGAMPGYSNIVLHGLFGGSGLMCSALRPDDAIDAALEAAVVAECARIVLELAGGGG